MPKQTSWTTFGLTVAIALTAASYAAASTTPLYGGGSTLVEKVYRDLFNYYGSTAGGDLCAGVTNKCPAIPYNRGVELLYVGVGSGNGVKAFDADDSSLYVAGGRKPDAVPTPSGQDFGAFYGSGTGANWVPGAGVGPFFRQVSFSGSDSSLSSTDTSGVAALGVGPAVQIPGLVVAIAAAFRPTPDWKASGAQPAGGSSRVQLSINALCGIFTGAITAWNNPAITRANNGIVLGTGKITVVYRNDSSGTTFLFTNALVNQCGTATHRTRSTHPIPTQWLTDNNITANATKPYYKSSTSFFINVFNAHHLPSNFYNDVAASGVTGGAAGNGGVQAAINATVGSIGYLSPDFVQPVDITGPQAANLQTYHSFSWRLTPHYLAPTSANATNIMSSAQPPAFTGSPAPAANPLNWGALNPQPANPAAYPIGGFSFIDLYSCYGSASDVAALTATTAGKAGFLTWYYGGNSVNNGIPDNVLFVQGFAPVPAVWKTAINKLLQSETFGIGTPAVGVTAGTKACKKISKGA